MIVTYIFDGVLIAVLAFCIGAMAWEVIRG